MDRTGTRSNSRTQSDKVLAPEPARTDGRGTPRPWLARTSGTSGHDPFCQATFFDAATLHLPHLSSRRLRVDAAPSRAGRVHPGLYDVLTGLSNRRRLDKEIRLRLRLARAGLNPADCLLIRFDLDLFKNVNDTMGQDAGDALLVHVANTLRALVRPEDLAARIGGDEFAVLMAPGTGLDKACMLSQRIQKDLAKPDCLLGRRVRCSASFGVFFSDDMTRLGAEPQVFADAALQRAKEAGRNRIRVFTPDLFQRTLAARQMAGEIQDALDRDQFVPFFQPQISALDGRIVGVETLVRWNHPERGLLSPGVFLETANQLRLVPEIDRRMMEKAREVLRRWRGRGLRIPRISFNIDAREVEDPTIEALARHIIADGTAVALELVESTLTEETSETFVMHLDRLRAAGIEIEIDDFGSSHASIVSLMQIAPAALKIDRRIVAPLDTSATAGRLLRAIVEIASTLGIRTVAEGVETPTQADFLRAAGCDTLQGFLFARPMSEDALLAHATALPDTGPAAPAP